ncbi:MAG: bifunctional adenosylcobinamide kinase/adenosylcobinamide-phosphate guanylyltransferase [Chloroflexota bacterium]
MSGGRLILVIGGARAGKSDFAEDLAADLGGRVVFVATAEARDEEMRARIATHQAARPADWRTVEAPLDVGAALVGVQADVALLDCLTLLVSNHLGRQAGDDPYVDGGLAQARAALLEELDALVAWQSQTAASLIVVSNEVGLGLVPPYPLGRAYRDLLGWANRRLALVADEVYLLVAGLPVEIKALARGAQHDDHRRGQE